MGRRLNDISKELDIVVHTLSTYPEMNSSIKMEVGIEDCLHIEFEYNKSKYDFLFVFLLNHLNHGERILTDLVCLQVSPKRCDCREDLLPASED